jgi:hypothetical protein
MLVRLLQLRSVSVRWPEMTPNGTPGGAATRIGEQFGAPSRAHPWLARLVMTLAAWLVAFLIATALLRLFGDELGSLPLELRALVISGVLVALMANLVMPALGAAIARWMSGGPPAQVRRLDLPRIAPIAEHEGAARRRPRGGLPAQAGGRQDDRAEPAAR